MSLNSTSNLSASSPVRPATCSPEASVWWLIAAYALVWASVHWLAYPNLDPYQDMLENYAWSQTFEWGTFKHPPFFVWVVKAWFALAPQTALSYKLLSYVNVGVGLAGVVWVARLLDLGRWSRTAVLLLLWTLPYTTLAAKFNANAVLLSVWPWTAAAWLASMRYDGMKGLGASVALGLLGAACVLSKYYSGVFLLALFFIALLRADRWRWFFSLRPYVALLAMGLSLVPHLLWLSAHDYPTFRYALDQGGGAVGWRMLFRFALAPLLYCLLAWLACVTVFAVQGWRAGVPQAVQPGRLRWWLRLAVISWRPQGWGDALFGLAMLPGGLTLLAGLAGVAELSAPWVIPIVFAFSLLWLRNLEQAVACAPAVAGRSRGALQRAAWPVLATVSAVGVALMLVQMRQGRHSYYDPTQEAALAMHAGWQQRHPGVPLGWTGGQWAENAMVGFYADPQVRALPGFPDRWPATLAPHADWRRQGGLLVCDRGPLPEAANAMQNDCERDAERWLREQGRPVQAIRLEAMRSGWRFPKPLRMGYVVYDVLP